MRGSQGRVGEGEPGGGWVRGARGRVGEGSQGEGG